MRLTPPKNSTFFLTIALAIIGLVIGIIGYFSLLLPAVTWVIVGLLIVLIAWLLLAVGVLSEGF
ncbi:MAG: hypothetical protein ACFFD8_07425 [Candidatus Thorarchaeota archaeon]